MRLLFRPIGPFTKALRSRLLDASERPVTLIDGFYRGHDHCQQALMCHDHVTIVAGGVAITPFLSMIFAIFKELQGYSTMLTETEESKKAQPILRSMTLVWSCREAGLLTFIKNSYLNDMAIMASRIPEFAFKIKIHYTGGKSLNTSTTFMQDPSAEISRSSNEEEVTTEENLDEKPATVDTKVFDDDIANPKEGALPTSKLSSSRGHTMELARMMPARFSSIKWNIPYFFAFSASVWLAFHIMFSQYDYSEVSSYRDNSELVWVTILVPLGRCRRRGGCLTLPQPLARTPLRRLPGASCGRRRETIGTYDDGRLFVFQCIGIVLRTPQLQRYVGRCST